jgi:hypothetical protein
VPADFQNGPGSLSRYLYERTVAAGSVSGTSQSATPPGRNMIAWRRWYFRDWSPQIPSI